MGICMIPDAISGMDSDMDSGMASGMNMATDGFVSSSIGPVAFHHGGIDLKGVDLEKMDPKKGQRPLKPPPFH
jgi:hypothetical protein